jgi:hypothetical protein
VAYCEEVKRKLRGWCVTKWGLEGKCDRCSKQSFGAGASPSRTLVTRNGFALLYKVFVDEGS